MSSDSILYRKVAEIWGILSLLSINMWKSDYNETIKYFEKTIKRSLSFAYRLLLYNNSRIFFLPFIYSSLRDKTTDRQYISWKKNSFSMNDC